jgi:hypothetical protein
VDKGARPEEPPLTRFGQWIWYSCERLLDHVSVLVIWIVGLLVLIPVGRVAGSSGILKSAALATMGTVIFWTAACLGIAHRRQA